MKSERMRRILSAEPKNHQLITLCQAIKLVKILQASLARNVLAALRHDIPDVVQHELRPL